MEEIATDFICVTWEKLQMSCRDEAYIINMDQTPVPFLYDPKKSLKSLDLQTPIRHHRSKRDPLDMEHKTADIQRIGN